MGINIRCEFENDWKRRQKIVWICYTKFNVKIFQNHNHVYMDFTHKMWVCHRAKGKCSKCKNIGRHQKKKTKKQFTLHYDYVNKLNGLQWIECEFNMIWICATLYNLITTIIYICIYVNRTYLSTSKANYVLFQCVWPRIRSNSSCVCVHSFVSNSKFVIIKLQWTLSW